MTKKTIKNLAASVHNRLIRYSHERNEEPNTVLTRYANERFLFRLTQGKYQEQFILKGALLFLAWADQPHRPTRDIDLLGKGKIANPDSLKQIFSEICNTTVEEDGLQFDAASIRVARIREEDQYGGLRVTLVSFLGKARIPIQVDVGIGDTVVPEPELLTYPTILDFPAPRIRAYRQEVVIAEKYHALVVLGMQNSRMKDIFDLWFLTTRHSFSDKMLTNAVKATFKRRRTPLPAEVPLALTEAFTQDPTKQTQWSAFLKKNRLAQHGLELADAIEQLHDFLWPLLKSNDPRAS